MATGAAGETESEIDRVAAGRAAKRKGSDFEREIARRMGGKRMVMSGGSHLGGGDLVFPVDHWAADFSWELKARKKIPGIIAEALGQAALETLAVGARKHPAAIIKGDNQQPVVVFFLNDFVGWIEAVMEVGGAANLKSLVRNMRNLLDEMDRKL